MARPVALGPPFRSQPQWRPPGPVLIRPDSRVILGRPSPVIGSRPPRRQVAPGDKTQCVCLLSRKCIHLCATCDPDKMFTSQFIVRRGSRLSPRPLGVIPNLPGRPAPPRNLVYHIKRGAVLINVEEGSPVLCFRHRATEPFLLFPSLWPL